jgi:uncharacterized protein (DUF983 family)
MARTREKRKPGSDYAAFLAVKSHCIGSELSVVNDKDIPISYILYVIGVLAIIGFLLVGGFVLFVR